MLERHAVVVQRQARHAEVGQEIAEGGQLLGRGLGLIDQVEVGGHGRVLGDRVSAEDLLGLGQILRKHDLVFALLLLFARRGDGCRPRGGGAGRGSALSSPAPARGASAPSRPSAVPLAQVFLDPGLLGPLALLLLGQLGFPDPGPGPPGPWRRDQWRGDQQGGDEQERSPALDGAERIESFMGPSPRPRDQLPGRAFTWTFWSRRTTRSSISAQPALFATSRSGWRCRGRSSRRANGLSFWPFMRSASTNCR